MFSEKRRFGNEGEDAAARFLKSKGFRILRRNVRVGRFGEIDIVCERGGLLIFVEVKTRRDCSYGAPEEALTTAKRRHFLNAIRGYLAERGLESVQYRADVIAVDYSIETPAIRHLKEVEL